MDENQIRAIVREELSNFSPPKKKRAPSKWQTFLKDCAKRQPEELVYTDRVKLCSIEYKDLKNNGGLDNLLAQNNNPNVQEAQIVRQPVNAPNNPNSINNNPNINDNPSPINNSNPVNSHQQINKRQRHIQESIYQ
jgi:hypothetical protein